MPHNQIDNASGVKVFYMPYVVTGLGTNGTQIELHWPEPVKGKVYVTVRADNPV